MPQSWFLHAAMDSEPVAELVHKGWVWGPSLNGLARANPGRNQLTMEELHPELGVIANLSPFEVRAPASPKMVVKRIERVGIDVFQKIFVIAPALEWLSRPSRA